MHALPAQLLCVFRYFLDEPRNSPQTNSKPIPSDCLDCVTALYSSAINIQWTNTAPLHLQAIAAPQLGRCTKRQMMLCSTYVVVTRQKPTVFATSYVQRSASNRQHSDPTALQSVLTSRIRLTLIPCTCKPRSRRWLEGQIGPQRLRTNVWGNASWFFGFRSVLYPSPTFSKIKKHGSCSN